MVKNGTKKKKDHGEGTPPGPEGREGGKAEEGTPSTKLTRPRD